MESHTGFATGGTISTRDGVTTWSVSLPLIAGVIVYCKFLLQGNDLLLDGDTYSHIATGRWILEHGIVPTSDPFSHTMRGARWTAFEWLSQVILAAVHTWGSWTGLVVGTSLAFAASVALLTRSLLRHFEPIYVVLFAGLSIAMTSGHVLARPHMVVMPLLMYWIIELVQAADAGRRPPLWLVPVMTLWANLHGSFTLGLCLTFAFAGEAVMASYGQPRFRDVARQWGVFAALAVIASLITPHGLRGPMVTWQTLVQDQYALSRIGEWRSPDFHTPQPLELWLLGAFAVALHQGLRLPPIRLLLILGLIHISLKHIRYVELLGLLAPLFVAAPLAAQWRQRSAAKPQFRDADAIFKKLNCKAGAGAVVAAVAIGACITVWTAQVRPFEPPASIAPVLAINAARHAGVAGPVLNGYQWGGYLIYSGIPSFIDGRSDLYRDEFLKHYVAAMELHGPDDLERLLSQHKIAWTLLPPTLSAVAMLDHLPGWRRVYADEVAVVHMRVAPPTQGPVQALQP